MERIEQPTQNPAAEQTGNPLDKNAAEFSRIQKSADEMADQGNKTEERFDSDHGIFDKM